jgi:hypothetical protein
VTKKKRTRKMRLVSRNQKTSHKAEETGKEIVAIKTHYQKTKKKSHFL